MVISAPQWLNVGGMQLMWTSMAFFVVIGAF